jgi:hypothetical protein
MKTFILSTVCLIFSGMLFSGYTRAQDVQNPIYPKLEPISQTEFDKLRSIPEIEIPADMDRYRSLPAIVDNSQKPYMRPLISQVGLECGQASSIGNGFTFEIDWSRNLAANIPQNQYPTHFAYDFINKGSDAGVSFFETWEILKRCGTPNVADYGGMATGGPSHWISGYQNYYHGMQNRITDVRTIHAGTPEGIALLKGWIFDHLDGSSCGGVANFYSEFTSPPNVFPGGTPEAGKHVIISWGASPNHAMTIVGYNDSIRWDYNGDGLYTNNIDINGDGIVDVKDWEIGGFKMANTYGSISGWGDQGYSYMMYKSLGDDTGSGGIWEHAASVVRVKASYTPKITMKVTLKHSSRNKLRVTAGYSADTTATEPDYVLGFPIFDFQGGDHFMQGGTTEADKTIEFGLDLNPLLAYINSGQRIKYFLQVQENDPDNSSPGTINSFSILTYDGSVHETVCQQTNTDIINNDITRLSVITSCDFSKPVITNSSLPPATLYQPYSCQLNANGGTQPYKWNIKRDYIRTDSNVPFPMITSNQVYLSQNYDGKVQVPLGFNFPFYGKTYDSITIQSDGYLMFDNDRYPWPYFITEKTMFTNTRSISPYSCSPVIIDPSTNCGIWFESNDSSAIVRWKSQIYGGSSTTLNFAARIFASGKIEFYYGQMVTYDYINRLAGISDGDGFNLLYTAELGAFSPSPNTMVTLTPQHLPTELSFNEDGLLSGQPENVYTNCPITFAATDNNNITSFVTLPFSTQGIAISCTAESGIDDIIEFGETAYINVTIQNITSSPINAAQLLLSGNNQYITLTDTQEDAGTIQPGQSVTFSHAFAFDVSHNVPDATPLHFTITLDGSKQVWSRNFDMAAYAPVLEIGHVTVIDNQNGLLDPGETVVIKAVLRNHGGALASGINASLSTWDPYIVINSSTSIINSLHAGNSDTLYFNVTALATAPLAHPTISTVHMLADNNFADTGYIILMIGPIVENFETNNFEKFDWTFAGNQPWIIDNENMWEGSSCATSGDINDDDFSALLLLYDAAQDDSISFYRKVSSELNYDYLRFSIDNLELAKWCGEQDWARESYAISKGNHLLKWKYTKDYSISTGSDAAWIDYIMLPAYAIPVGNIQAIPESSSLRLYPNPSHDFAYVEYVAQESACINIRLFDCDGKPINTIANQFLPPGKHQYTLNLDRLPAGTYYCVLTTPNGHVIRPLIITGNR